MLPPALIRLLIPRRYQPHADRIAIGALIGLIVPGTIAALTLGPTLGDNTGYVTFPVAIAGLVVGAVVGWRTRRR